MFKGLDQEEITKQANLNASQIDVNREFDWVCLAINAGQLCLHKNSKIPERLVLGRGLKCECCGEGLSSSLSTARKMEANLL